MSDVVERNDCLAGIKGVSAGQPRFGKTFPSFSGTCGGVVESLRQRSIEMSFQPTDDVSRFGTW
jgi:hypothetical protein